VTGGCPGAERRAVVTGGSSGIGAAVVEALAAAGWHVVAVGRDPDRLARVVAAAGPAATSNVADLEDDAAIERLVGEVGGAPLHALVHAAGRVALGTLADAPPSDLDALWRINVRAPLALTRGLLPALRAAPGDVVFLNSGSGLRANGRWGAYAATKFALRALADALRDEERDAGVRVTSVYPGRTDTAMQRTVFAAEGRAYDARGLVPPEAVARMIRAALETERPASVPDLEVRPA
jgi:NAD(P)-dependent dehydrogenase (short-subunit alcohol dehydrogenase family)